MENNRGRKKKEVDYNSPFAARLRDLLAKTKTTQPMLAEAIGVSRQAIGQWKDGNTLPDIVSLGKIADYFNVSADYLLGRTEVATSDMDLQAICDYTNLSEKAIENITEFTTVDGSLGVLSAGAVFNKLCENGYIFDFCQNIFSYFEISDLIFLYEKIIEEKKHNNQDSSEYEELLKAAKSDCDYFKWYINNYVNQISDYIVSIFRSKLNNKRSIESHIAWYGDIQAILKHHKKIRTAWLSYFENSNSTNNGGNNHKKE